LSSSEYSRGSVKRGFEALHNLDQSGKHAIVQAVSVVELAGVPIPFASPRLLLRMKQTGREKDALDLLFLRELLSDPLSG